MKVRTRYGIKEMTTPAEREARIARVGPAPVYSAENLNPRSRAVTDIFMSIKRSQTLSSLCAEWLEVKGGDTFLASRCPPFFSGIDSVKRKVKEAFGVESEYRAAHRWAPWWPWVFRQWMTGRLEGQAEQAALNLPSTLQGRLKQV